MKLVIAIAAASLLLTGCGGEKEPEVDFQAMKTEAYLNTLREVYPKLTDVSDEDLIGLGEDVCSWLNKGRSPESFVSEQRAEGVPPELTGSFIGASVPAFCPQHLDTMSEWASGN